MKEIKVVKGKVFPSGIIIQFLVRTVMTSLGKRFCLKGFKI